jgi:chromatin remodeling complex protein RSC6
MMAENKKKAVKERTSNSAFMKAMKPSEALAKIVGKEPLPRSEMTKKLWEYIKKHNLQDAENRRNINADENLLAVFDGKKQVSMFEMTKLVNKHLS